MTENPIEPQAVEEHSSRLEITIALLIALITVVGALVAWRASVAADAAGDEDVAGLRAVVNVEETRALSNINAYENYRAFISYQRSNALGDELDRAIPRTTNKDQAEILSAQRDEANDLALSYQELFPNRFLNRNGDYALERQLGEMYSDAARERDLDPDPHFSQADSARDKSNQLLVAITILGIALVVLTFVEVVSDRAKIAMVGLGSLLGVFGTVFAIWIETRG